MNHSTICTQVPGRAPLHVCLRCRFHDPKASRQCREPVAKLVSDKTRPNFCGWFQPRLGTHDRPGNTTTARAGLAALFGEGDGAQPGPANPLDELFRKD